MLSTLKSNAALAVDGLFGPRYGFFELMEEARTHPAAVSVRPAGEPAPQPAETAEKRRLAA